MAKEADKIPAFLSRIFGGEQTPAEILKELQGIDPAAHDIVAAAMEVHDELGYGYPLEIYRAAMAHEMRKHAVPFAANQQVVVRYKEIEIDSGHTLDFVCHGNTAVMLRSDRELSKTDDRQFIGLLKATGFSRGLLINLGPERVTFRRMVKSE
jgi:GxxExxY protein